MAEYHIDKFDYGGNTYIIDDSRVDGKVSKSGDTMSGGLTFGNDSNARNDKGIIFTGGSRIGEDTGSPRVLGIYGQKIAIRPNSLSSNSGDGIEITSDGLYPANNNSESLGLSNKKWANVYATTFNGALNGNASTATIASYLGTEGDNRTVSTSPSDYTIDGGLPNRIAFRGLKNNTYINSPSSDSYSYLIGLRGWSNDSGGKAYELAFNDTGIFIRKGSSSTWESWEQVSTSSNTYWKYNSTTESIDLVFPS